MGDDITTTRTRTRTNRSRRWLRVRLLGALATLLLAAGACGSSTSSPDVSLGAAAITINEVTEPDAAEPDAARLDATAMTATATGPPPAPTATPTSTRPTVPTATVPTPTPQPELPPASADAGDPITDNIVVSEALGLTNVCSLYAEADRLSELLGEFWTMTDGIPVDQKCLWVSAKDSESSAVVSIEIMPTDNGDNEGTTVGSDLIGPGLAVSVAGTEYVINVVTDDVDATLATLNVREAEERIAEDILERVDS